MSDVTFTDFHLFSLGGGGGIWVNSDDAVGRAMGWDWKEGPPARRAKPLKRDNPDPRREGLICPRPG